MQFLPSLFYENRREIIILVFLSIILGYGFYHFQGKSKMEDSEIEESGVLQMEDIVVNNFKNNLKGWELKGEKAIILEESKRMRIENVLISIFVPFSISEDKPKTKLTIRAEEGLLEWKNNRVTLLGDVVLNRNDGSVILTETAVYDSEAKVLTIPKKVRILKNTHSFEGKGLIFNVNEDLIKLNDPLFLKY